MIRTARVYDAHPRPGEAQVLVDRLWPRGVRREALALTAWAKDAAPSAALRRWYHQDRSRWPEFCERYRAELAAAPEALAPLLKAAVAGDLCLLYAARDRECNHALVLQAVLEERLAQAGAEA